MIFYQTSNLPFRGLRQVQELLLEQYADFHHKEDTLLVIASIPSLNLERISELKKLIEGHSSIIFWCFGDFLWNIPFWHGLDLQDKKVLWVVASSRWRNVALRFFAEENVLLHPHPFIIQPSDIVVAKNRARLLFFAGRRSRSKNLPWLVRLWKFAKDHSSIPLKLAVAGPWCDYGENNDSLKKMWFELLKMYPDELLDLGELKNHEVSSWIQAADVAISLSTFAEEDFGLFLREARTLGTPVLATDWGGHSDLKDAGSILIDVQEGFNLERAGEKLLEAIRLPKQKESYLSSLASLAPHPFKGFKKCDSISKDEIKKMMSGLEE